MKNKEDILLKVGLNWTTKNDVQLSLLCIVVKNRANNLN
jgi:hypothetical protein